MTRLHIYTYHMPFDNTDRKMYEGNWKCSKCGAAITSLPFDPDPSRLDKLQCRDCHKKERDANPR